MSAALAATLTVAYFFASLIDFLLHSPVSTKSIAALPRSRFIGTMAFCPIAPPCMNSTVWPAGTASSSRSSASARSAMPMKALPRWLISITDMPSPCQSSISSAAWRSTGSGSAAGPALKL